MAIRKQKFEFGLIGNILRQHRNAFAWLVRWGQGQTFAMLDGLMFVAILICILMPVGVITSWVGFNMNTNANTLRDYSTWGDRIIGIGDFLIVLSGLIAAIVYGAQLLRLRLLTAAVTGSNAVIRKEIEIVSAPLWGPRFDIGMLFTEVQASQIIKISMSVFAAIVGGALYAAFIPVYTSLTGFFAAMLLVAFLAYASAWLEGSYWLPIIKRWSIVVAALLLLIYLPVRFAVAAYAPDFANALQSYVNIPKAQAKVKKAVNDGNNQMKVVAANKIKALMEERVKLVSKDDFGSAEDMKRLDEINKAIQKWQSDDFITPTPTPASQQTEESGEKHRFNVSSKGFTNTGLDVTGKTVIVKVVSGSWNNVDDRNDQGGQGIGYYPGTLTSDAKIGELIAKVSTKGSAPAYYRAGTLYNIKGELSLGMNDVPGKEGDNHGELIVEVTLQ